MPIKRFKLWHKRLLVGALTVVASGALFAQVALAGTTPTPDRPDGGGDRPGAAKGLGQLSGLLPASHLTEESAIQVDLSNETARMPLYKGTAYKGTSHQETVWFVLLDASDSGLDSPAPAQNHFGAATVNFQGAPDFSPTRVAVPGPKGFPLTSFQPGGRRRL